MARGDLFILSAPSGTGKTTLIHEMMQGGTGALRDLVFSVSHTTRAPRPGEKDGRDYHFVDRATFERMRDEQRFLEHAQYNDNWYGTSLEEVEPRCAQGTDVIMDIDVQGARQVLARWSHAIPIFIMPPSFAVLRERLMRRHSEDGTDGIDRRLRLSIYEINAYTLYRYVIINDDKARASEALASIILARRHRRERMGERAKAVLRDFQDAFGDDALGAASA